MDLKITPLEAWADFWAFIKTTDSWHSIPRAEKQYLYKAQAAAGQGKLGYERIKHLLERYAPERYEFQAVVTVHQ